MIEFSSVGEGSKPKPFDGASNISSSSFIATFHAEPDGVRACRLASQPARGSLWAPGIGGRGLGRLVRVTAGGASLHVLYRVLGYNPGGTPATLCSQNQKPYHIGPYIILSGIISQHRKKYTLEYNIVYIVYNNV